MNTIIDNIKKDINKLFLEMGFKEVTINGEQCYCMDECYYKVTYLKSFDAFVIESADSYDYAKKDIFEDSDVYPLSLGDDLINIMRNDLKEYYILL